MAKRKAPPPLLAVKHDFVDSLDAMMQESLNLISAIGIVLDHGKLPPAVEHQLRERLDAFRKKIFVEE